MTPEGEKVLNELFLSNLEKDNTEHMNFKDQYPEKVKELQAMRDAFERSLEK